MISKILRDRIGNILIPFLVFGMMGTIVYLSNANNKLAQENGVLQTQLENTQQKVTDTKAVTDDIKGVVDSVDDNLVCFLKFLSETGRTNQVIYTTKPCVVLDQTTNTKQNIDDRKLTLPKAQAPNKGAAPQPKRSENNQEPQSSPQELTPDMIQTIIKILDMLMPELMGLRQ